MVRLHMGHAAAVALAVSFAAALPARAANVAIEFHDGRVAPLHIEVPANTRFKIEVHNSGRTASEFESHRLHKEKIVPPHSTVSVEVQPLARGRYDFFDDFHEKAARGIIVAK